MAAMGFAGMARSYMYPQADRHDCLQFAARQRSVEDGAAPLVSQWPESPGRIG